MENAFKILGFAGSLRKDSYNKALLRAALELVPKGVELEIFDLEGIPPYSQDLENEPVQKVKDFKAKIKAADAILIATCSIFTMIAIGAPVIFLTTVINPFSAMKTITFDPHRVQYILIRYERELLRHLADKWGHIRRCPIFKTKQLSTKGGVIMKRVLTMVFVSLLSVVVLCVSALAQDKKPKDSAGQDLLVKSEVETAISMLQAIYAKHKHGEMTLENARKLGADLLRELTYGTDGYFWADTIEGVNVVLYGRKDVEGRNRLEDKDNHGTFYIKEMLAKAKAGGGYVDYSFSKKGQSTAVPKRSYVLLFKPFGWVVGSGYYR